MNFRQMAVGLLLLISTGARAVTVSEGRAAYERNKVGDAERIYASVVADTAASAADRSAAERELARIAWLIDGNSIRALAHLSAARSIGDKPCDTSELVARVLRESSEAREALKIQHVAGGKYVSSLNQIM